jgi:hypothetical protein
MFNPIILLVLLLPVIYVALICWFIWEMVIKDIIYDYKQDKARKITAAEYAYKAERAAVERARWKEHGPMFDHIITIIKSDTATFNALENDAERRNFLAEKMQPYVLPDEFTFTHKYGNALRSYLAEQSKLRLGNGHALNYLKDDVSIDAAIDLVKVQRQDAKAQRRNETNTPLVLSK